MFGLLGCQLFPPLGGVTAQDLDTLAPQRLPQPGGISKTGLSLFRQTGSVERLSHSGEVLPLLVGFASALVGLGLRLETVSTSYALWTNRRVFKEVSAR